MKRMPTGELVRALSREPVHVSGRWRASTVLVTLMMAVFAVQVVFMLLATNGELTYTLDDPYIHLALAESISQGEYGVNPGELSSPSSSPLWPFLLAVTAGSSFQDWVPLIWTVGATLGCALVLLAVFSRLVTRRSVALALTVASVFGLNLVGVAFTGMEHSLQVFSAVLVGYGMVITAEGRAVPSWLPWAMIAGPLIRYENVAVSAAAALILFTVGHRRIAIAASGGWLAGLAGFSAFLIQLGLDPLPSSVLAKSAYRTTESPLVALAGHIGEAFTQPSFLAVLVVLTIDALVFRRWGALHWFVAMLLTAHAVAGNFGANNRYEVYLLAAVLPALATRVVRWRSAHDPVQKLALWAAIGLAAVASIQVATPTLQVTAASKDIWSQQAQTARFVAEYWQRPIAVNDLGLVAYRSDERVLDLWGLASQKAREARHEDRPGWLGRLVTEDGAHLAAIYVHWFPGDIPADWVRLGEMTVHVPVVASFGRQVAFFATDPATIRDACNALTVFGATTPPKTRITLSC